MIRTGQVRDCPVTLQAVEDAELMFGPDMGTLKGKLVTKKPPPATTAIATVPPELVEHNRVLPATIDVYWVAGRRKLLFLDLTVPRHVASHHLKNASTTAFYEALDKSFNFYNQYGFRIGEILSDGQFKPLLDPVKNDLQIQLNCGAAQTHNGPAERMIRVIEERYRALTHSLPFLVLPGVMVDEGTTACNISLTLFPAKEGISQVYSPRQIITGRTTCYKDFQYSFGSYCLAHHSPTHKNTNEPRGLEAIYLRPVLDNHQGGHYVMDLHTWKVVSRQYVTILPMPRAVIDRVEKKAFSEGMKPLKFHNRDKVELLPVGLPAGVAGNQGTESYLQKLGIEAAMYDDDYIFDDDEVTPQEDEPSQDDSDDDSVADDEVPPLLQRGKHGYDSDSSSDSDDEDEPVLSHRSEWEDEDEDLEPGPPKTGHKVTINPTAAAMAKIVNPPMVETVQEAPKATAPSTPIPILRRSKRLMGIPPTPVKPVMTQEPTPSEEEPVETKPDDDPPKRPLLYETETARVLAQWICDLDAKLDRSVDALNMGQQHLLAKGLKVWKDKAVAAARKEMDQLNTRGTFDPILPSQCTPEELKKAQVALMFVTEKRDGTIKARTVYNGKPTRVWQNKEDSRSPTVSLNGLMLTMCVDASEDRDVMSLDVPNAFVQTPMPPTEDGQERVIMKIEGELARLLAELDPQKYKDFLIYENGRPVIYVVVMKALYGMLVASLLWYKKFRSDLESIGFEFNPYDPCVANRMVNGTQQTIRFHIDDLMSSHKLASVNQEFLKWCNDMYGTYGEVKATTGKKHDYLGMTIDFSEPGVVKIDMIDYLAKMLDEFPVDFDEMKNVPSAAPADLFQAGNSDLLDPKHGEVFHTFTAKLLFACKRARPDMQTLTTVLCTRVKGPTVDDWNKLLQGLKFIHQTVNDKLILRVDDIRIINWWVDASFAVHPDMRSHTGGVMSFGSGAPIAMSAKQKLNARSSTDAELIGADDVMSDLLWSKLFMEAQGIEVRENILHQDNKSAIILEQNGKASSGKRTRALNIRFFFIHDQINQGNLRVVYCPTKDMRGDFFTKPLQGKLFHEHRAFVMGHEPLVN